MKDSYSEPFLIPFQGLDGSPAFDHFVVGLPVLIAIVAYSIAAYTLIRLFWLLFYRPENVR